VEQPFPKGDRILLESLEKGRRVSRGGTSFGIAVKTTEKEQGLKKKKIKTSGDRPWRLGRAFEEKEASRSAGWGSFNWGKSRKKRRVQVGTLSEKIGKQKALKGRCKSVKKGPREGAPLELERKKESGAKPWLMCGLKGKRGHVCMSSATRRRKGRDSEGGLRAGQKKFNEKEGPPGGKKRRANDWGQGGSKGKAIRGRGGSSRRWMDRRE